MKFYKNYYINDYYFEFRHPKTVSLILSSTFLAKSLTSAFGADISVITYSKILVKSLF
jgi:hypothetical protein